MAVQLNDTIEILDTNWDKLEVIWQQSFSSKSGKYYRIPFINTNSE
jgi:hypothetical protein